MFSSITTSQTPTTHFHLGSFCHLTACPVHLPLSICLTTSPTVCLSIDPFICLFVWLPAYLSAFASFCLYMSICPSDRLSFVSAYPSVCLPVRPFVCRFKASVSLLSVILYVHVLHCLLTCLSASDDVFLKNTLLALTLTLWVRVHWLLYVTIHGSRLLIQCACNDSWLRPVTVNVPVTIHGSGLHSQCACNCIHDSGLLMCL